MAFLMVSPQKAYVNCRHDMAIDLYFYRKRRGSLLPNIPVIELIGKGLGWVVEKVQNQLVVVHAGGTLTEPEISAILLKDASEKARQYIIFNVWAKVFTVLTVSVRSFFLPLSLK